MTEANWMRARKWEAKNMMAFIRLAFNKQQAHRQSTPISGGHDLGVAASACLASLVGNY